MLKLMELFLLGTVISLALGFALFEYLFGLSPGHSPKLATRNDIEQLGIALENFKSQFGFYPPSRLLLCEKRADYSEPAVANAHPTDLVTDSRYYLLKMFPRMVQAWDTAGIDFDGSGGYTPPLVLWGDQCLVFFLGGIPTVMAEAPGVRGFGINPANPIPSDGNATYGPYIEFKSYRLVRLYGNAYPSYMDAYRHQPYAYFSSGRRRDNYNRYGGSDCDPLGVWPYAVRLDPSPAYHNPRTYQIISAGGDGRFGRGTLLPNGRPWTPETSTDIDADGRDDLSNFSATVLGGQ